MDSSNPFGRKTIDLDFVDLSPILTPAPKQKKKRLSSDLLEKKLKIKSKRAFHKDMKKEYPIGELSSPSDRSRQRQSEHARRVDIRKAQEAFQTAKKAAKKTKKASNK